MADKTSFTPDEWKVLLESVMMAGVAVTAADPNGLWGALKESFASAKTMLSGKTGSSPLIQALVADLSTSEGRGIAREGLREQLKDVKPAEIKKVKPSIPCVRPREYCRLRVPMILPVLKHG